VQIVSSAGTGATVEIELQALICSKAKAMQLQFFAQRFAKDLRPFCERVAGESVGRLII